MTTLVIHPDDPTTAFLKAIYANRDWTVVSENTSKSALKTLIKEHDRIIMLGHGDEKGLFGFNRYVIDSTLVYLLRKKVVFCIWCYAEDFVNKYDLKGFYTGMIISDFEEAWRENVVFVMDDIQLSNELLARTLELAINENEPHVTRYLMEMTYKLPGNFIVDYNAERIFATQPEQLHG